MGYVQPNKNMHAYVIGIDFGHGETSADICRIQWNDTSGQLKNPESIEFFGGDKTVKSVLLIEKSGDSETHYIGENAIIHNMSKNLPEINKYFYEGFKKVPSSMSEEERNAMCIFMKEVYKLIRDRCTNLTDNNHLVYIACPSNPDKWNNVEILEYAEIALDAGIPLVKIDNNRIGIIRESRAAFVKARSDRDTRASVKEGLLLIDFGSSTVDLTYYSSKSMGKPIDDGYECGASKVEYLISDDISRKSSKVAEAINTDKTVKTAIRLKVRSDKEKFYSYDNEEMEVILPLKKITGGRIKESPEFYYSNDEIDSILSDYKKSIQEDFLKYRENYLKDKSIELIFLTGGASRMNFIEKIASDVFNSTNFYKEGNPSLTISNGIALVGRADLRTYAMENELLASNVIRNADIASSTVDKTASVIANRIIIVTERCYSSFARGEDRNIASLESEVMKEVNYSIQEASVYLTSAYNDALREVANTKIIPSINKIVKDYFPDFEIENIKASSSFGLSMNADSIKPLNDVISRSVEEIEDGIIVGLGKLLWNITIGTIIGTEGLAINGIIWGINQFRDKKIDYVDVDGALDEVTFDFRDKDTKLSSSRRTLVKEAFIKNKETYKSNIETDVKYKINSLSPLINHINDEGREEIKKYISKQIDDARIMLN